MALKQARASLDATALREVEDRCIADAILKQEDIGLGGITDGELRREFWHIDFLAGLDGVESYAAAHGIQFKGGETKAVGLRVTGRIGFSGHPMLDHFRFLKEHTRGLAKMTLPSPSVLHFRGGRAAIPSSVYARMDDFYADLGAAYNKAVTAFVNTGCRYLQLDEVNLAYLCDPEQRRMLADRGDDPEELPRIYADLINAAISGRPADMAI